MSSHGPVRYLACPARFERATYALEGLVALVQAIMSVTKTELLDKQSML